MQKRTIHIICPFTWGMSYSNTLFVAELTSLESIGLRDQLSKSFFQDISTHPLPSIIYFPIRVIHLSCFSSEQPHGSQVTHQKYCSFINYALNHYQVPPRYNYSRLNPFLCRRFTVSAVYLLFLNFLVLSSYSTFKRPACGLCLVKHL